MRRSTSVFPTSLALSAAAAASLRLRRLRHDLLRQPLGLRLRLRASRHARQVACPRRRPPQARRHARNRSRPLQRVRHHIRKSDRRVPVTITGTQGVQIVPASDDGITITDSAYVTVQGLGIYGARRNGVFVTKSENMTIKGCGMLDSGARAVHVTLCDYVTVEACEIRGTKGDAAIVFTSTEHPGALDNNITENPSGGIYVIADASVGGDGLVTGANIARNQIVRNTSPDRDAIRLEGVERSTIASNVIDDNRGGGIIALKGSGAKAGTHNKFLSNVVRFTKGNGLYGLRILEGSTRASVSDHVIAIDAGPSLEIDEASAKGFKSSHNFFPSETGAVIFVWNGQKMDLTSWQAATRQDADSHVARVSEAPAAPAVESTAPSLDSSDAAGEAGD